MMTRRIFRSIIAVAIAVLIAGLVLATGFLYEYFNQMQAARLHDELQLAAAGVEQGGVDYLLASEGCGARFTLVAANGGVLYDSRADVSEMDNHLGREEIVAAMQDGEGVSRRYSTTLTEQTFYEAVQLTNGAVLRISATQGTMLTLIWGMLPLILAIVLCSVIVARLLSKQIAGQNMEAERNRREFSANVSHELKTPLQAIIGSAELLENGLVKPEDTPRFIGNIKKEAVRLVGLINDIIRLSQLDEGEEMPREDVDMAELVREVADVLQTEAVTRGVNIKTECEACRMMGVQRYLYEIAYNLCDNAVRYNRPGGSVLLAVSRAADGVRLLVRDTGIGIPAEQQDRIFERFYRVDKSHSRETGGTGLGLSIVKHAVQYHGGDIQLKSEPGRGTEIVVRFPFGD